MEKQVMDKLKELIVEECNKEFGFCGVAEGDDTIMINTGKEKDLIIKMEIE